MISNARLALQAAAAAGSWDKCSTHFNLSQDHFFTAPKTYVRVFYEFGTTTSCSSADGDDSVHEPTVVRPTDANSSATSSTHQQPIYCVPKLLIFLCFTFKVKSETITIGNFQVIRERLIAPVFNRCLSV